MCNYVTGHQCSITNQACPYMYYCSKSDSYKPSNSMPEKCKVSLQASVPKGYYRVRDSRNGYLYIDVEGQTIKVKNPFSIVPEFVKAFKTKQNGWRIKK